MDPARIAELLKPFLGSQDQRPNTQDLLASISTYIDLLLHWNARINLTAVRDPEEIVTRHFGESLFAARHLFPRDIRVETALGSPAGPPLARRGGGALACPAERGSAAPTIGTATAIQDRGRAALQGRVPGREQNWALAPEGVSDDQTSEPSLADLGSGAGFPGLPIKLWAPHISLTLIESNHKKATFLREVTRALTLTDVDIQAARAEALTGVTYDVVTLRAVERFQSVLPVAARLLGPGGKLALLIASVQFTAARSALPDLVWAKPEPVPLSRFRILAIAHRNPA